MFLLTADFTLVVIWKGLNPWACAATKLSPLYLYTSVRHSNGNWMKLDPLMYFLLKMGIFHCYVSLPEGNHNLSGKWLFEIKRDFKDLYIFYSAMIVGGRSSVKCCFHKPKSCSLYGICVYIWHKLIIPCRYNVPVPWIVWEEPVLKWPPKETSTWRICHRLKPPTPKQLGLSEALFVEPW